MNHSCEHAEGAPRPRGGGCSSGDAKGLPAVARRSTATFGILAAIVCFFSGAGVLRAAYRVESLVLPEGLRGGVSAIAFTPRGTLVLATRYGELWMQAPDTKVWRRFARGLNEPLGIVAESEKVVYVAHRPELLAARDTDGDGRADDFQVINDGWGLSQNYHEFFFGLRRDAAGNFYGALGLESSGDKLEIDPSQVRGKLDLAPILKATDHRSKLPWRGWAVKITPDGKLEPLASGLRQPNGVGLSPDGVDMFVTDNQGDWKPSCGLIHVDPGAFLGHVTSLRWEKGFQPGEVTEESAWRRYQGPAVVFPHGPMGASAGEPVWDVSDGKFGPFGGQVFVGDFTSRLMRVGLDKVAGAWQGAVFPFIGHADLPGTVLGDRLSRGGTRMAFAPDGSLYVAQTAGWGGGADGVQRVSWDGRVSPEVLTMTMTERGFAVTFTHAMNAADLAKPETYGLKRFRFYYQAAYGSPWVDEAQVGVKSVQVSADGHRAELVLEKLEAGFVYELSLPSLHTAAGEPLANPLAYYTANRLRSGEIAVGGTTRLPRPSENAFGAKEEVDRAQTPAALIAAGKGVYQLYCVACHQTNGRGITGGAANFVDDKSRLAKSDQDLLNVIGNGNELKGMPAFGAVISPAQRKAALAYIRDAFGEKP